MISQPNGLDLLLFLATLGVAAAMLIYARSRKRSTLPYPPGPKRLPVLGNLLDIPTSFEWETYARWGKEYDSDILHLNTAGNDFVILNSLKAATDLLEKRSAKYSNRPQFTMVTELMGWKWVMSALQYGERWRERRRAFAKYFHANNSSQWRAPQMEFVRKMLPRFLDTPEDCLAITKHAVGGMALSIAYGLPIRSSNDPLLDLVERAVAAVSDAAVPGAFWVDIFPILKYVPEFFPGTGFMRKAKVWRKMQVDMRDMPFQQTIRNMVSGIAKPSFTSTSLQNLDESRDLRHQQEVIQDTAAVIFAGGADTTVSTIHTFFNAMLSFPETHKKAQEELDRVLGGRLPEFGDEADLPYVSAIVKELLRWKPVTPIALPHCSTEDDVYQGYHIPKGSIVIPNVWAMLHDEDIYSNPSTFNPDRFMKDGLLDPSVRDPGSMAFGFGRRICPGNQVGLSFLWLTVATILATFDVTKVLDEDGTAIEPSVQYQSSIICHPLPFRCTLKPRSKAAEELIRSTADSY
ncbi:hypothetical protein GALMADRAFT_145643 [Galerina marginata CBS 339.88]|uniref:Cytochrome P450 n=1 Tax=Galerina marginata (strain CBS 339.88) TaxID=685588 RepID=A0A067SNF2_GALM3|nr:hypothetical protein GALMADRAFT_145643 [Galerina marginata CBS 339.88]